MPLAGALAVIAVLAAIAGPGGDPAAAPAPASAAHDAAARRALLMPVGSNPFRVRGSGFRARERVRVTITPTGRGGITRRVRANGRGTFTLAFAGIDSCGGVHGVAAGSRGSPRPVSFSANMCF